MKTRNSESFSNKVKEELLKQTPKQEASRKGFVSGLISTYETIDSISKDSIELSLPPKLLSYVGKLLSKDNISFDYDDTRIIIKSKSELVIEEKDSTSIRGSKLRGMFLGAGYLSDPAKAYKVELHFKNQISSSEAISILKESGIKAGTSRRGDMFVVSVRNGDGVSDFLSLISSSVGKMDFESVRAFKEVNQSVSRVVNCDAYNIKRQSNAALIRNELITKLMRSDKSKELSDELRSVAMLTLENPGASLSELGALHTPTLSKSGLNHRIDKLLEIAKSID